MAGSKYVPNGDMPFCLWGRNVLTYATEHHKRWGIEAPDPAMVTALNDFEQMTIKCANRPQCTPQMTFEKNVLRKTVETGVRNYVQGVVIRNVKVTDEDRKAMGLPIYDRTPTPAGTPEGQAEADISYPGRTQLMLHIRHVAGTPANARANYGCRIYYGVYPTGQSVPKIGAELSESRFTRVKKELFDFGQDDSGKTAVFCIRYENSKGKVGPWGPVMTAIIP